MLLPAWTRYLRLSAGTWNGAAQFRSRVSWNSRFIVHNLAIMNDYRTRPGGVAISIPASVWEFCSAICWRFNSLNGLKRQGWTYFNWSKPALMMGVWLGMSSLGSD